MKKYKTQAKLLELFSKFNCHSDVLEEIMQLVVKKGKTAKFIKLFEKNISMMEELGKDVTKAPNFEKLRGAGNLYSMKFKSDDMNIRILYTYDNVSCTLLLCCFDEKADSGKDSYSNYIPVAMKRKREMEGDYEN